MNIKTKVTTEVKLTFNIEQLKILFDKLQIDIQLPLDQWTAERENGEFYMSKSPTDEVEEFLMDLHLFFKNHN